MKFSLLTSKIVIVHYIPVKVKRQNMIQFLVTISDKNVSYTKNVPFVEYTTFRIRNNRKNLL